MNFFGDFGDEGGLKSFFNIYESCSAWSILEDGAWKIQNLSTGYWIIAKKPF